MRTIKTRNFGELEVEDKGILSFPAGIPGFEQENEFFVHSQEGEDTPFLWLVAVTDQGPAFLVTSPNLIVPEYGIDLPEAAVVELELTKPEDAIMYVVVSVPQEIEKMSANLRAPIVINTAKNIGKQVVLEGGDYTVKHYILEALKQSKKGQQGDK